MSTIDHENYEAVIGLEVHAQLLTESKAFTSISTAFGAPPNTQVSPLCVGHPGTLPVLNENLVRYTIKMGLATQCEIARKSIFARKNYFYPDLPKGYQISQYDTPICYDGTLHIDMDDYEKDIGIKRIHMEEDAGKSIHDQDPHNTLIDLNRAGVPLIEIVSEPHISTPEEAYAYLGRIKQIVTYLGICDGNMEEGSLRCDANVSVKPREEDEFGTRTELKNLNSFRNVERGLKYEIERQIDVIESGDEVVQDTLLWDPHKQQTQPMRTKEEAHDYRYFPEPDIPPVIVTESMIEEESDRLPEMPDVRRDRFKEEYGLSADDAYRLTEQREVADFFEKIVDQVGNAQPVSNLVLTEVLRVLNERSIGIRAFPVSTDQLAELIQLRESDKISSSAETEIFDAMVEEQNAEKSAEDLAKEMNLMQVSDTDFIEPIIDEVIASNPDEVKRYQEGKKGLIGFFIGQTMEKSQGKANPKMVREMIAKKLENGDQDE